MYYMLIYLLEMRGIMEKKEVTDKIFDNITFDMYRKIKFFTLGGSLSSNIAHWISVLSGGGRIFNHSFDIYI